MLETKLGHHAHTLRPAPFAILILAFAEVILASYLDAWRDVPEEVERAVQSVSVLRRARSMVGQVAQLADGESGEEVRGEMVLRCAIPSEESGCIHCSSFVGVVYKVIVAHDEVACEAADATAIITHEV